MNITLQPGETITNQKIQDIFKCSVQGGMRRSHRTNSLVLISDYTKGIYEDRWIENEFHYTGMGLTGDQSLSFHQNKTLAESSANDVDIYLFEVFEQSQYTFIGQVELSGEPYQENQSDKNGRIRKVWIFPLELRDYLTSARFGQMSAFLKLQIICNNLKLGGMHDEREKVQDFA